MCDALLNCTDTNKHACYHKYVKMLLFTHYLLCILTIIIQFFKITQLGVDFGQEKVIYFEYQKEQCKMYNSEEGGKNGSRCD